MEKEKHISEDIVKKSVEEMQKLTDSFIERIDALVKQKEKEILEG